MPEKTFFAKYRLQIIALSVIFGVLFLDQFLKIWVKTHFYYHESFPVFGNWFQLLFIENRGMAFGMEFAGNYGKIILSVFRLVASVAIAWYLVNIIKKKAKISLIIVVSLIFTGAVGNIFDSVFYGLMFSESTPFDKAVLFPDGGGYAGFLHGEVVDMLYLPIINTTWPEWVPWVGGKPFEFFSLVFNVADAAITIGGLTLLFFQKRLFKQAESPKTAEPAEDNEKPLTPAGQE